MDQIDRGVCPRKNTCPENGRVKLVLRVIDEHALLTLSPWTVLPPVCADFATGRCPLRRR
jgi:hypothetical protein